MCDIIRQSADSYFCSSWGPTCIYGGNNIYIRNNNNVRYYRTICRFIFFVFGELQHVYMKGAICIYIII